MKAFVTDKQTVNDLNIFGKFKQGSLFNIFNRVQTRGGELLLESMFRSPLTEARAINLRSSRIAYFHHIQLQWEVSRDHAELASGYLSGDHPSSALSSYLYCSKEKLQEILYKSEKYLMHQKQIYAVQELLLSASALLGQLQKKEASNNPCRDMQDQIDTIINSPSLKNLRPKYPYTLSQMAECHYVFCGKSRKDLETLLKLLYEFDVYLSVAEVARVRNLSFAGAFEQGSGKPLLAARNLRHPALENAVGNSLTLTRASNMLFLTGANMAGKSTWMKTLGASFYLAHMGFPVAADSLEFTVMEGIYTSINVADDIAQGWSHFYAEVMRVKTVATEVASGKGLFILFDELFKGTNVKDAFDATLEVSKRLPAYGKSMFVISSHIVEVGEELSVNRNIQFRFMPTEMEGPKPVYTYKMAEGISSDRQGMIIIENEKIMEMLA